MKQRIELRQVEEALLRLWIDAPGVGLRREDKKKALELCALLGEIQLLLPKLGKGQLTVLDAAAGKAYAGILAGELLLHERPNTNIYSIEQDPRRVLLSQMAVRRSRAPGQYRCVEGNVDSAELWPTLPSLVIGLHACGVASDAIIDRTIESGARSLLLIPCCIGKSVPYYGHALRRAASCGLVDAAPVRRRFVQSFVESERHLRLEQAGYRTEIVEFVAPRVTPYNTLFRAFLSHDSGRAERAKAQRAQLLGEPA